MIRLAAFCTALLACAAVADAKPAFKSIRLNNAEDMLALPGGRWVIASSMPGGAAKESGLYAVDSKSGKTTKIYPTATPSDEERPGCGKELTADVFSGLGLSLQVDDAGAGTLYAINHGGRESVEMFDVIPGKTAATAPSLKWKGCVIAPDGALQNSIATLPSGKFFVTMTRKADFEHAFDGNPMFGHVRAWSPDKGWTRVVDSEMSYPNGIVVTPDGSKLYVDAWLGAKIVEITLSENQSRRAIPLGFSADNVRWAPDGALLVAGHDSANLSVFKNCVEKNVAECGVKSIVARIDPETWRVTCAKDVGPHTVTVATPVGNELWLGSARSTKILRMKASSLCETGAKAARGK